MFTKKSRKGFTTVELVIVIAVIAILATALIPTFAGLIRSANHNVDVQTANTLTKIVMMHSVNNKITGPRDLEEAIDAQMGEGYFQSLTAKSAQYGYDFWYDIENGQFMVKTVEEIAELYEAAAPAEPVMFYDWGITMSADKRAGSAFNGFMRSAMFPGYYLIGSKGEFGSLIASLENAADGGDYEAALNKVYALTDTYAGTPLADAVDNLVSSVETTVIINNNGAFRYRNVSGVVNVYITAGTTELKETKVYTYEKESGADGNTVCKTDDGVPATATPITSAGTVELPAGVKVEVGGLPDNADYPIVIVVSANTKEELAEIFGKNATDCVIDFNGQACIIVGENIVKKDNPDEVVAGGLTGEDIKEFDVTCPGISTEPGKAPFYYVSSTKTIFVAYNQIGAEKAFNLGLTGGLTASQVKWESSDPALISVNNGVVTVNKQAEIGNTSAAITVTYGELAPVVVNVALVRPNDVDFAVTGAEKSDDTITITYTGAVSTFPLTGADILYSTGGNTPVVKFDPELAVLFETAGEVFELTDVDGTPTISLKKYSGEQTLTVKAGDLSKEFTVKVIDNSGTAFDTNWIIKDELKMGAAYLFRVGNMNTFTLGDLFNNPDKPAQKVAVKIDLTGFDVKVNGTASATDLWELTGEDWANATVKFEGTGVAEITVGNYIDGALTGFATLKVEVVNGKNVTTAASATASNIVLLRDVSTAGLAVSGGYTLFGNGFKVTDTRTDTSQSGGWISINNGYVDNAQLLGQHYPKAIVSGTGNQYYKASVEINKGGIYNSLVTGGRFAILVSGGAVDIVNTTVDGGALANIKIQGVGSVVLDNLTTIQKSNDADQLYGLGIWVASSSMKVTFKTALTQYNWGTKTDADDIPDEYQSVVNSIFTGSKYTAFRYTDSGTTYVNTGILFFDENEELDGSNLTNRSADGTFVLNGVTYSSASESMLGKSAVMYAYDVTTNGDPANVTAYPSYKTAGQHAIKPVLSLNIKNDAAADSGDREYFYYDEDAGVIRVGFKSEAGVGYTIPAESFAPTATKFGASIPITVTMSGTDYTGKPITFTSAGEYTITLTYTDSQNYDKDLKNYSVKYTYEIKVIVIAVEPDAKHADFTFHAPDGTSYTATTVVIDGKTYVMPNVSGTTAGKVMSTTVNGVTVYAPYVETMYKDNSSDFNYIYPLFKGVTITDYADGKEGGAATTYDTSYNSSSDWGNNTSSKKFMAVSDIETWNYAIGTNKMEFKNSSSYGGTYMLAGAKGSDISQRGFFGEISYTDNAGAVYYYFVYYNMADHKKPTGCVTGDTLVTLADGTKKEIQNVTTEDMLLVWSHFTGKYEAVPAAIIFDHGYGYNTVIKLNFSDGTQVKAINLHQFLDVENGYVTITAENVARYVGHRFTKRDGDSYTTVTLDSYEVSEEYIEAYGIISALHYNILVEDMFSTDFMLEDYDLFNYFTICDGLVFDAEKMEEDIAKYGLYTYEDFADYLTYEQFAGFNVQYFKIAVGKGDYTYEGILGLIDGYLNG